MKFIPLSVLAFALLPASFPAKASGLSANSEWKPVPDIIKRIVPPVFPGHDFVITNFGAVADGKTVCTAAIAKAIETCAAKGGGRVVVPSGEFLTGPIHLKSNVNLHLASESSTLKFVTDPDAYLPAVLTRFEGVDCYNYSPLVYAAGQVNVAVTGLGTLDGQADASHWWPWKGLKKYPSTEGNQQPARDRLWKMNMEKVPVDQRRFGAGDFLRPDFIQFQRCQNVLIEGVRIRRSPMWEVHPLMCTNVTVRGVEIVSHGPNNDGCDPESCTDVLIEKCRFETGDDCIAIKSGRNNDGRRLAMPSQNIVIRDCVMRDGHGGVVIGSEISGGCSGVFVENCEMNSPELDSALRLKSNAARGGVLQNIFMRNIKIGQVKNSVLNINFLYEEGARGDFKPIASNIVIEDIQVDKAPRILNVRGFPAASITGVRVRHSTFEQIKLPDIVEHAEVKVED